MRGDFNMSDAREGGKRNLALRVAAAVPLCLALLCVCALAITIGVARYPEATGDVVLESGGTTVDISHAGEGYLMVRQTGSKKKLKARIVGKEQTYTYNLRDDGEYETFPLTEGSGEYKVYVFENVRGNQYAQLFAKSFTAEMPDEKAAFLYPNQYTWYSPESETVKKSRELCEGLTTDLDKLNAIFSFVADNVSYDYAKAKSVRSGYLPDVDKTLDDGKGICFDTAALMACMLRTQGIPTRVAIGYLTKENAYHAWNEVYVDGAWTWRDASEIGRTRTEDDYRVEQYF
jgi:transglutaminase-like putative cysteine protease